MDILTRVSAVLRSAIMSASGIRAKRAARVIFGAAVVVLAYLTITGPRVAVPPGKAPVHFRLNTPALPTLQAPVLPGLRSALSLTNVHAQAGCSDESLSTAWAGYSYNSSGQSIVYYSFNGTGSVTAGEYWSSNGTGTTSNGGYSGSYTLDGTCTGTMSISTGGTFDIVLTENGTELDVIPTNSGSQFMEILKPLWDGGNCTNATLSGYFGGYSQNDTSEDIDEYDFNGAGSLTGSWYGPGGNGSGTGTYNPGACVAGTMSLSTGGTFYMMVVQNGALPEVDMIATNKGSSFWEILKAMQ